MFNRRRIFLAVWIFLALHPSIHADEFDEENNDDIELTKEMSVFQSKCNDSCSSRRSILIDGLILSTKQEGISRRDEMKFMVADVFFFFRPNVCSKVETRTITKLVPCVKSYDHLVKVWSKNCTNGRRICPVYEHR